MIETSTKIEGLSDLHQQLEKLVDLATEKKKPNKLQCTQSSRSLMKLN